MDIDNINHVGMAVRDLMATATRYEAMAFSSRPIRRIPPPGSPAIR